MSLEVNQKWLLIGFAQIFLIDFHLVIFYDLMFLFNASIYLIICSFMLNLALFWNIFFIIDDEQIIF